MTYLLASAARATVGARSGQEDAYSVWPAEGQLKPSGDSGMLAVLADGMGGHRGGAVAGQTACATFTNAFAQAQTPVAQRLDMALNASNDAIADAVDKNSGLKGMGCTLIGAWLDDTGMRWTSVGDSLLLLYRFPDVIRLNEDHSLGSFLDEQARRNEISQAEARGNRHRNALRSALTGSKIDLVDMHGEPLELVAGDWILLASDGIASLEGDELADIMFRHRDGPPDEMAQALIAAVEAKGMPEQDNTTIVAIRVEGASETVVTRTGGVGDAEGTLRTKRIGVVSRRKAAPPANKPSTSETLVTKGPRALLLAAAAAFIIAAAIFIYNYGMPKLSFSRTTVGEPEPGSQRPPVQPTQATPTQKMPPASTPQQDPPTAAPPAPGPRPPAPAQPQPPTAVPPEQPILRGQPQPATPSGPGAQRRPTTTSEDPDSTLPQSTPAEMLPGGGDQTAPQPQQGGSGPTRGNRKSERSAPAPAQTRDESAKQGNPRR